MIEVLSGVQGVCAWPNLTLLPGDVLIAAVFNQPCHGMWEGDLDCYASENGGRSWRRRGTVARHDPGFNRMNCAVGLARGGALISLCSGWSHRKAPYQPTNHQPPASPVRAVVTRSADGGATWDVIGMAPETGGAFPYVPFGDIHPADDGSLRATAYVLNDSRAGYAVWMLRSADDGKSWSRHALIDPIGNETAILPLGDGRWLAAVRQARHLQAFHSADDGRTWTDGGPLGLPLQITGHLLRLRDGRLLLSMGNRCRHNFGVDVRVSDDRGRTWGAPIRLANTPLSDCGYPSTVQLSDGRLATAFYAQLPGEYQYEMRTALWDEKELA